MIKRIRSSQILPAALWTEAFPVGLEQIDDTLYRFAAAAGKCYIIQ